MAIDNLMVVAFGGPTKECCGKHAECPGQAFCFVNGIFGDNPARRARVDEVVEHYKFFGGFSRFNEITEAQANALQAELKKRGHDLKLTIGYDHWMPWIADQVAKVDGEFLVLVMTPHQSAVSWDAYLRRVSEGLDKLDESSRPKWAGVVDPFWNKPGFIEALADRVREAAKAIKADLTNSSTGLVLSAHSIPMSLVKTSKYVEQIKETAELVAAKVGAANWMVAYQSAPSDSKIEWTTPYLERAIEELKEGGAQKIVAAPIGFLCDNVEVLYDLGVEGKNKADELDLPFAAAESVNTHPAFIKQLADNVEAKQKELAAAL
ncbi:MAG: ferrochelatase [Planctomycetes bacterium]|nr:ferrochelatase [Planctomycetota bacterium]MCB9935100.1 ferrochelatase [Planctomycetota bacterium]